MKPPVARQGTVIIEETEDDGILVLYPDGNIVTARDWPDGERKAQRWLKHNADPKAINVGAIEKRPLGWQEAEAAKESP